MVFSVFGVVVSGVVVLLGMMVFLRVVGEGGDGFEQVGLGEAHLLGDFGGVGAGDFDGVGDLGVAVG